MTMTATGIPLCDLHLAWPELWPLLEPAVKRSADRPDVLARLIARDAQLWAIHEDGKPVAAVVTMIQVGREKRCLLWLVGGSRMREWAADFLAKVEDWARGLGCVALWGCGRAGWARIAEKFGGRSIGLFAGEPAWERRIV